MAALAESWRRGRLLSAEMLNFDELQARAQLVDSAGHSSTASPRFAQADFPQLG
jgi:hypothetical protein